MGRYYNGDIEGKFGVAIQPSDAPSRFGVEHTEPNFIEYYFSKNDLPKVQAELKRIEDSPNFKKTKDFLDNADSYSPQALKEEGITDSDELNWYDWRLGKQIEKCLIENGECEFECEL